MRRMLILAPLLALLPAMAAAQSYDGFDQCGYAHFGGMRIYFDETVTTGCGGILMDPGFFAYSATNTVTAWLVLTNPTASTMSGWQADLSIFGEGAVVSAEVFGEGGINTGAGDTWQVTYATPRVLGAVHEPLAVFELVLDPGTPPWGMMWGRMEFWLGPAAGLPEADPGFIDGGGAFHACSSLNSDFHGWGAVPCMLLNDAFGVTDTEPTSFGALKALFR